MSRVVRSYRSPYDQQTLFAVAADIESYPAFLPNCVDTRIVERHDNRLLVDNHFRWGVIEKCFKTRARLQSPTLIEVESVDAFPVRFSLCWHFTPLEVGTAVRFEMEISVAAPGAGILLNRVIRRQSEDVERAFLRRVAEKAGTGSDN
jgi:coenzyme Q-binding protein COQ10